MLTIDERQRLTDTRRKPTSAILVSSAPMATFRAQKAFSEAIKYIFGGAT
jgi:hypothetical protein